MGSISLFLLLIAMSGAGVTPGLVQLIINQRKDSYDKWSVLLNEIQELLVAGYFYLRGPQEYLDAAGKPASDNPTIAANLQQFQKDFLTQTFFGKMIGGIVRSILALLKPSAAEEALMSALLSGRGGFGGTTNNVSIQQPPAGARTARQVLQTGPRAQAVYVNERGETVIY